MKVVYLSSESFIDHSYTIVRGLKERSREIDLKVFFQAKDLTEEVRAWCGKTESEFVKRRRFRNPLSFFDDINLLRKAKKQKADVVWFNTMTVYQAILAPLMLKKYIVTMHDVELHPESAEKHGTLASKLTLRFSKRKIAAASKTQAEIFNKQYGILPRIFQLPIITYFKESARSSTGLTKTDHMRFFFFGSIEKYKGIETLLEAAEILESKGLGLKFEVNIHGRIKYDNEILAGRISKLKSVNLFDKFIDYREIHSIYTGNDVQILPYKQVTQCGPLLIGFCEGVPSICSDLAGFREYVSDAVDGIMFDGTAQGLAEKMETIVRNKATIEELKRGIEKNALKKFSMAGLTDKYIENLKQTAGLK
ncbi:MAG: glycosyltransferase family 4 protein [Ignavibacteria bacterium]|nr:glycosyltransferase family 4 protein [Ignavibacteria bacterium]